MRDIVRWLATKRIRYTVLYTYTVYTWHGSGSVAKGKREGERKPFLVNLGIGNFVLDRALSCGFALQLEREAARGFPIGQRHRTDDDQRRRRDVDPIKM